MGKKDSNIKPASNGTEATFYRQIADLLTGARTYAKQQIDSTIVVTYFEIGRMIVEREQQGKKRAQYGLELIKGLSEYLSEHCGRGFSMINLQNMRKFYLLYSPRIQQTVSVESQTRKSQLQQNASVNSHIQQTVSVKSQKGKSQPQRTASVKYQKGQTVTAQSQKGKPQIQQTLSVKSQKGKSQHPQTASVNFQKGQTLSAQFRLSWSHYLILIREENEAARRFYEIEAINQQWSVRTLQREVGKSLYERLGLSRNKKKLLELASEGQKIENPLDLFKKPYILEFTGLEERPEYSESDLEQALIDNLQRFMLELGKGFLFEARQKRFSFDEKSFYVDLVFYNRLLQCYVLIDLKVSELKHEDLGQMQMYVNYYDRYVCQEFENPTIGILLCSKKNDNMVELTLPKGANIYAEAYSLLLPDKKLLQSKLTEWIDTFEEEQEGNGK